MVTYIKRQDKYLHQSRNFDKLSNPGEIPQQSPPEIIAATKPVHTVTITRIKAKLVIPVFILETSRFNPHNTTSWLRILRVSSDGSGSGLRSSFTPCVPLSPPLRPRSHLGTPDPSLVRDCEPRTEEGRNKYICENWEMKIFSLWVKTKIFFLGEDKILISPI